MRPVSKLKKSIDEKRFGDLVLGDAYVKWSRIPSIINRGHGGAHGNLMAAALDEPGHSFGGPVAMVYGTVESVQSVTANIRHKNIEVEDTVVSTLKFANGALGTIECSTAVFPGALKRIEIMGNRRNSYPGRRQLIKWEFEGEG